MQRHDDRIRRGTGGHNERKELRCRNCTHVADFLSSSSFEQGKKANDHIPERRGNALTGPFNASPAINRMPPLVGFRNFIALCASIFIGRPRSMSSSLRHVYDFPKLWFGQRHD